MKKLFLGFSCALILVSCQNPPGSHSDVTVLKGATILDGNGNRIEKGIIIIHENRIRALGGPDLEIPDGAEVRDLGGKYITPGLIDAHVHFAQTGFVDGRPDAFDVRDSIDFNELQARLWTNPHPYYEAYLRSGVTAVYDVGGFPWSLELQQTAEGDSLAPHVAAAGPLLSPVPQEELDPFNTPTEKQLVQLVSAEMGRNTVAHNSRLGATGIKIWQINLEDPDFMQALKAVAEEVKKQGNQLIVHATTLSQAKEAVRLGAKVLVHSIEDEEADVAFLASAKREGVIYIPTLVVLKGYYNTYTAILDGGFRIDDPHGAVDAHTKALLEGAQGFAHLGDSARLRQSLPRMDAYIRYTDSIMAINLMKVYRSGIRIAVGTDAGNPGTLHGISIFDELEAMQEAGISAKELVVMATRNGAQAMRRAEEIGTLEPGKIADLVLLDKDPEADIKNLRSLTHVMRNGYLMPVGKPVTP